MPYGENTCIRDTLLEREFSAVGRGLAVSTRQIKSGVWRQTTGVMKLSTDALTKML